MCVSATDLVDMSMQAVYVLVVQKTSESLLIPGRQRAIEIGLAPLHRTGLNPTPTFAHLPPLSTNHCCSLTCCNT